MLMTKYQKCFKKHKVLEETGMPRNAFPPNNIFSINNLISYNWICAYLDRHAIDDKIKLKVKSRAAQSK